MGKNQNLKIILAVEIVIVLCIGIGIVGIIIYAVGGSQVVAPAASGQPPVEPPTAMPVPTTLPTDSPTTVPTDEPVTIETPMDTSLPEVKGMVLEKQSDKTTKFTDLDGGYEVIFPAGWLVIRPGDEEEYSAALAKVGTKNTGLIAQMKYDKSTYRADIDRIFSYPLQPDTHKDLFLGYSGIELFSNDTRPLDNHAVGVFVNNLETSPDLPGLRVRVADFEENGNQVPLVVVKGQFLSESGITVLVKFLIFKPTSNSMVRLTFATADFYEDHVMPDVDEIQESIKLLDE